ncbi:hypothetical protein HID58_062592 [Brassica napus]|uniref:Uncharacterized protein n=1 Tax=Brassica napus TaxID=3708 RepID=A0ABQ8A1X3_BRANA|nr:hypothetical protein HID58_062592 [Brassica napus]
MIPSGLYQHLIQMKSRNLRQTDYRTLHHISPKRANKLFGANFAVAGATANDFNFLKERGLSVPSLTNKTLDVQLGSRN